MNTSLTGRVEVARCTHLSLSIDVPVEKRRREREWRLVAAAATVAGQPCNNPRLWR